MTFVIDASVLLSWCFDDEATEETDAIAQEVVKTGAFIPSLFYLAICNVLLHAQRRGRITIADAAQRLELLARLPLNVDHQTSGRAAHQILALAWAEKLTVYHATYLELAIRKGAVLATKDRQLAGAARHVGLQVRGGS